MLALGVLATIAANAVEGAAGGPVGVLVSAWPAVAFVGGIELLIWVARTARLTASEAAPDLATATAPKPVTRTRPAVASADAPKRGQRAAPETRAERHYAGLLTAGELPSVRAITRDIRVGAPRAREIRAHLATVASPA
jgi:hypothetical protein